MALPKVVLVPKEWEVPPSLHVLSQGRDILPRLEELVKLQAKLYTRQNGLAISLAYGHSVQEKLRDTAHALFKFFVPIGPFDFRQRDDNFKKMSRGYEANDRLLIGDGILYASIDATVDGCVIYAPGRFARAALGDSVHPTVRDSFIFGFNALAGSINPFSSAEQYAAFLAVEKDLLSRDPEHLLRAIIKFSETIQPPTEYKEFVKFALETCPAVNDLYNGLPAHVREELRAAVENPKVPNAAHRIYYIMWALTHEGDTYNADVSNSVVFGNSAGSRIKGGTIRDSIFAGKDVLEGANVTLKNTYLVTPEGTRLVKEEVLGQPDIYEKVPVSLGNRRLWTPRLAALGPKTFD